MRMGVSWQPGGLCTSSSQELRSLLFGERSPEFREEMKLRSFPISSERRVCSSCRHNQETSMAQAPQLSSSLHLHMPALLKLGDVLVTRCSHVMVVPTTSRIHSPYLTPQLSPSIASNS